MIIRKTVKKDSLDIWLWRTDEMSVFFSKNKKKITIKNHNRWFKRNLKNPKEKSYIGLIEKKIKKKKLE
jgi:hypothetical protein